MTNFICYTVEDKVKYEKKDRMDLISAFNKICLSKDRKFECKEFTEHKSQFKFTGSVDFVTKMANYMEELLLKHKGVQAWITGHGDDF